MSGPQLMEGWMKEVDEDLMKCCSLDTLECDTKVCTLEIILLNFTNKLVPCIFGL